MAKDKIHSKDNPKSGGLSVKRDADSEKIGFSNGDKTFRGVRKEALEKLGTTLNKLAKYDKK